MSTMPADLSEAAADFWHKVTGRYLLGIGQALLLDETAMAMAVSDRLSAAVEATRAAGSEPSREALALVRTQRAQVDELRRSLNLARTPRRIRRPPGGDT